MSCNCGSAVNSGVGKQVFPKVTRAVLLVPKFYSDGTKPFIDATFDLATLEGYLYNPVQADRWHLLFPDEVVPTNQEVTFQTLQGGENKNNGSTPKRYSLNFYAKNPRWIKVLQAVACDSFDKYIIDDCQVIWGGRWDIENKKVFPYKIASGSGGTNEVLAQEGTTISGLNLQYDISKLSKTEETGNAKPDFDVFSLEGLLDVYTEFTPASVGATTLEFRLFTEYGNSLPNAIPFEGVALADFGINFFLTGSVSGAITPSGLTEVEAGLYQATVPALVAETITLTGLKQVSLGEITDYNNVNQIVVS